MTSARHVLVVDPDPRVRKSLPALVKAKDSPVIANAVATISDALAELQLAGYDAVLLRLDEPGEIALLLRIKESHPRTPVIAILPEADERLAPLAQAGGADAIQLADRDPEKRVAVVSRLLESTADLVARSRTVSKAGRALMDELGSHVARSIPLRERSIELTQDMNGQTWADLVPLLVEDDNNYALLLKHCFLRLGVRTTMPVLRTGEDAVAYLSGQKPFDNRDLYPLPNAVVLDLGLARLSGLDVLDW